FHLASDSTLWIGSNGYGIYRYETDKEKEGKESFIAYTTEQGLINNNVRGILEDNRGRLWISTNNGLSSFDPTTKCFTNYTKEDGLTDNQFYWNAYCHSKSDIMYFGGLNGLVAVDPNRRETHPLPGQVTFTRLQVANEEIRPGSRYIDTSIAIAQTLKLHESDKSFSLEFSALNHETLPTAMYSYRLLGFDKEWIDVPVNRRFASYTNLPAGSYTFQVRYSPEGNIEESPITELQIIVSPFFYKTWWFICLMIMIIGCSVIYFYTRRLYTLQKQKELLHQMVEERTRELKEQNEKITKQKAQLIHMSKKVQELTVDKLTFFTNITHEFRTPITLIMGPIERALKLSYNPQVIEQLSFVERNSKYLLSLVNQLMDFRKVDSGKLEIVKSKGDLLKFVDSLIIPFEVFAGERNIRIRKLYRVDNPEILFDQDAMHKVITNLLSNAIKFTPDGGAVSIYIASCTERESGKERLYISVKDTGTGIPEEDLSKIFNRFYQSNNHVKFPVYGQSGTGIGLYLCKRIVKLHGGNIKAKNNRTAGSTFLVNLPLIRKDEAHPAETITEQTQPGRELEPTDNFIAGKLTILIVEDNKDMRSYIRSILTEQYNIFEAENGAEALEILTRNNVDFIISDLMMPVMDGIELSRRVKETFTISHIPFLMLTAKTSQESRIESYRTGVDEYLLKPFNEELLLTRITNILENRKRHQQRFAMNMEIKELQIEEESNDKKFLDKVLSTIKENYKNSYYEAGDFIEAMGVSKSLLNKKMQNLTGQSIGQFIRNYRLNIARELIEKNKSTHNMNVSEIAYEVGFNDPKYFTRCFTKRYNVTPSSLMEEN
ncbi:response regulator, partial [Bacteroides sp. OttesenSCG-928-M17]|nr:response regulator [Bacteroides sp. OttesenSCG-928-M17]